MLRTPSQFVSERQKPLSKLPFRDTFGPLGRRCDPKFVLTAACVTSDELDALVYNTLVPGLDAGLCRVGDLDRPRYTCTWFNACVVPGIAYSP